MGTQGWRTPFWLYAVSLPLAVAAAILLWQPESRHTETRSKLDPLPWRRLAAPIGVTLVGGLVFYALIVELSYVLDDVGITSTATIGFVSAIASLATAIGAFTFSRLAGHGPSVTVPLAFVLSGIGLIGLGLAPNPATVIAAAIVTGLGNGLLLPSLVTWALSSLTFTQRGRGTGAWTAALFIGQFVCPLAVLALSNHLGGLPAALATLGVVALAMSGIARTVRT